MIRPLLFALVTLAASGLAQEDQGLPPPNPPAAAAPAAAALRLDGLDYARGIEWGGDHIQLHLRLTRQADGSYRADYDGEDVKHPAQGVAVPAEAMAGFVQALEAMLSFPDDSFAGEGNHWFTRIEAKGERAGGQALAFSRDFYDSNSQRVMAQAGAFERAVTALIERLTQQQAAAGQADPNAHPGGLAGALPQ